MGALTIFSRLSALFVIMMKCRLLCEDNLLEMFSKLNEMMQEVLDAIEILNSYDYSSTIICAYTHQLSKVSL